MQSPARHSHTAAISSPRNGHASLAHRAEAMKVSELRAALQDAGVASEGKKADLVSRYIQFTTEAEMDDGSSDSPHK
jgi:hypothetical protein